MILFAYRRGGWHALEERIPASHPLRKRTIVNAALAAIEAEFTKL
jgi:hypothetical protein